jgi:GTPase SAR1 family protein
LKKADAIILLYDITNQQSVDNIYTTKDSWSMLISSFASFRAVRCLAGNKMDLSNDRKVDQSKVKEISENAKSLHFEISTKENKNVDEMFQEIGSKLISKAKTKDSDENWKDAEKQCIVM